MSHAIVSISINGIPYYNFDVNEYTFTKEIHDRGDYQS